MKGKGEVEDVLHQAGPAVVVVDLPVFGVVVFVTLVVIIINFPVRAQAQGSLCPSGLWP